ncbi:hypothetical protein M885DRAFT_549438 [Pelagophyceae sp. CCMP2097]|nr:hypothetical protein M885DRAFT_549438 [Pelagophyceae sp. CCMP2097]
METPHRLFEADDSAAHTVELERLCTLASSISRRLKSVVAKSPPRDSSDGAARQEDPFDNKASSRGGAVEVSAVVSPEPPALPTGWPPHGAGRDHGEPDRPAVDKGRGRSRPSPAAAAGEAADGSAAVIVELTRALARAATVRDGTVSKLEVENDALRNRVHDLERQLRDLAISFDSLLLCLDYQPIISYTPEKPAGPER